MSSAYMSIAFTSFFMTFGAGFDHPQSPYIIQRKFKKIQRNIMSVSVLAFSAIKSIKRLVTGIVLHSLGPNASFDTHIVLSRHFECQMLDVSFMS